MAITVTVTGAKGADYSGDASPDVIVYGTVNLGNPYATGGIAITAAIMNAALATAGYETDISTIDRMIISPSAGSGANRATMKYDQANGKIEAYTAANTLGALGTASIPGALAVTTETGLTPSSHVTTPAGTPLVFLRGQITTAGGGGATGCLNLQDAAPANSLDGQVTAASGLDTTVTTLAADDATAVTLTFLTWTAGSASVATATGTANEAEYGAVDLSNANYTSEFCAFCSK